MPPATWWVLTSESLRGALGLLAPTPPTCDGSPDLPGRLLAHLDGRLLTIPGRVGGADQVGGILQGALAEARTAHCRSVPCPGTHPSVRPSGAPGWSPLPTAPDSSGRGLTWRECCHGHPCRGPWPRELPLSDPRPSCHHHFQVEDPPGLASCPRLVSQLWGPWTLPHGGQQPCIPGNPSTWCPGHWA